MTTKATQAGIMADAELAAMKIRIDALKAEADKLNKIFRPAVLARFEELGVKKHVFADGVELQLVESKGREKVKWNELRANRKAYDRWVIPGQGVIKSIRIHKS